MSLRSKGAAKPRTRTGFRSVVLGEECRHRHALYREARDCGYKRLKGSGTWDSSVVGPAGETITADEGAALDASHEAAAREARYQSRQAEISRLRQEQRAIDESQWWNPLRPRERGE